MVLPAPFGPDEADALAGADLELEVLEDRVAGVLSAEAVGGEEDHTVAVSLGRGLTRASGVRGCLQESRPVDANSVKVR